MNLAQLVLQPRRFFEEQAESVNWTWPLVGFYFFSFASFFQQFVIHELRMPYWLVVFIVAWAPAATLAICFFGLLVLLWYWPASRVLGTAQSLVRSTKIVGVSLLPAGLLFSVSLLVVASVKGNGVAAPYQLIVGALQSVFGIWALGLIVLAAVVSNKFPPRKTVLFVLWLAGLVVLFGVAVYAVTNPWLASAAR
jgi:hypothetical protein